MDMDSGELVDKCTIARLYVERDEGSPLEMGRFNAGLSELKRKYPNMPWDDITDLMYTINGTIWDYEAPIHS